MKKPAKTALTRQAILRELRRRPDLLQRHAVRKIALFGSYAKGKQTGRSDIDFLVELAKPTHDNFLDLSRELARLFGKKAEILTPEGLESIRVKGIAESIRKTAYA
jgi:hypothetical protein